MGLTYDSGDYTTTLDKALEMVSYQQLRKEQADKRKQGKHVGIGLSTYLEICGLGPSVATTAAAGIGFWGMAVLNLHFTGKATLVIGSSPHGQGHETPFAQIVAETLGLPLEDIDVVHGDTAIGPMGMDTYGSRSASVDGTAVYLSAVKVREKARKIAAHLLEAAEEDVVYENGKAYVKGSPTKAVTIQEITGAAYQPHRLPAGMEGGLDETTFFNPPNFVWPFGAHIAVVEIDDETGRVQIQRYVAVDDCGTRLNPLIVDGQIHGGIAQGIGQALFEDGVYGEDGQLKTGTLVDYLIPTAPDLPMFETESLVTPSPTNPLGVKGIGEAGTIASSVAVINAVVDALQPFGVKDVDMPASPDKVWHLMHKNGGSKR
jgi:carbon-monoxide dehydrogenase large subunit